MAQKASSAAGPLCPIYDDHAERRLELPSILLGSTRHSGREAPPLAKDTRGKVHDGPITLWHSIHLGLYPYSGRCLRGEGGERDVEVLKEEKCRRWWRFRSSQDEPFTMLAAQNPVGTWSLRLVPSFWLERQKRLGDDQLRSSPLSQLLLSMVWGASSVLRTVGN